jgi:hypothetical protein
MTITLIILTVLIIWIGVTFYLIKSGKIEDKDGNGIPDTIDNKLDETKERVKRVKEEVSDVVKASKEVIKQVKDIGDATKGKIRRGRKPKQK